MSDYKLPEEPKASHFALKALAGFLLTPCAAFLLVITQVPALFLFGGLALVVMLFFRFTVAFALGGLLSIGVAFLALLALCGNSRF
jgi:hypothetical protein